MCFVNAINNCFGREVLSEDFVFSVSENLSKRYSKQFSDEKGNFHQLPIQVALQKTGFKLHRLYSETGNWVDPTVSELASLDKGKYVVMGFSDPTSSHVIAIDADNDPKLVICDTRKGFYILSVDAILNSLKCGVHTCFKIEQLQ